MNESLDTTRAQLRRYLIPGAADTAGDSGDLFPRSKVMRFAFNPRNRHLLVFSGSVLAVLASRMVGANRLGMVTDVLRSFTRNKR
ncbi:MAG: hypothetical protein ABI645_01790 [Pseudomonadota bacterium]